MSAAQAPLPSPTASASRRAPVDTLRQTNSRPFACISIAAILAVFILAFATTPKTRAQDHSHHLPHAARYSKWKQQGTDASCWTGRKKVTWWAKTDDGSRGERPPVEYRHVTNRTH
jgi:hypothetical protein